MTETKRFLIGDAGELIDLNNRKFIDYGDECCKLLNKLHEENEKLKHFREKVFSLIEEELDEHPYLTLTEKLNPNCKNYHSCRGNHEKNVFYASRHTLLEKLREELSYD